MQYFVGVDLGTSSVRALVTDSDGMQRAVAGAQYDVLIPRQGWAEQDPEEWYTKTCAVIREAVQKSGVPAEEIAAVSFSGQMHGLVALREDGTPAQNAFCGWISAPARQLTKFTPCLAANGWLSERKTLSRLVFCLRRFTGQKRVRPHFTAPFGGCFCQRITSNTAFAAQL